MKKIKAWAVAYDGFQPVGNGNQYQYPIFPTRREAIEFKKEVHIVAEGVKKVIILIP